MARMTKYGGASLPILLASDLDAARRAGAGRLAPLMFPNVFAVGTFRLAAWLRGRHLVRFARASAVLGQLLTGADIDPQASIGPGLFIWHTSGVVVGPGVRAGENLRLGAGALLGAAFNDPDSRHREQGFPTLGDGVQVMAKASVLGRVRVGDNAIIGAHAVVVDDVPVGATVVGVPARVVRRQPSREV